MSLYRLSYRSLHRVSHRFLYRSSHRSLANAFVKLRAVVIQVVSSERPSPAMPPPNFSVQEVRHRMAKNIGFTIQRCMDFSILSRCSDIVDVRGYPIDHKLDLGPISIPSTRKAVYCLNHSNRFPPNPCQFRFQSESLTGCELMSNHAGISSLSVASVV
jgi:hypothetical protein